MTGAGAVYGGTSSICGEAGVRLVRVSHKLQRPRLLRKNNRTPPQDISIYNFRLKDTDG